MHYANSKTTYQYVGKEFGAFGQKITAVFKGVETAAYTRSDQKQVVPFDLEYEKTEKKIVGFAHDRSFKLIDIYDHIKKGEKKTVHFVINKDDFSYIGIDMKKTFPDGMVKVMIKDLEQSFDLNKID